MVRELRPSAGKRSGDEKEAGLLPCSSSQHLQLQADWQRFARWADRLCVLSMAVSGEQLHAGCRDTPRDTSDGRRYPQLRLLWAQCSSRDWSLAGTFSYL